MFTGANVECRQPIIGQIAASGGVIFLNIARNVGELEREAQVASAVECRIVLRRNPHDHRHHHADGASNMIAITIEVALAAWVPIGGV